jgi:hypothetical protein
MSQFINIVFSESARSGVPPLILTNPDLIKVTDALRSAPNSVASQVTASKERIVLYLQEESYQ